jgi:molybdopterin converting factor small subunit
MLTAMKVTVRLFGVLAERASSDSLEVEVDDGAMVRDAVGEVARTPGMREPLDRLSYVIAVNREHAHMDMWLHDGDEIALIPPGAAPA